MEFSDDYTHENSGVMYLPQSIPTKEIEDLYEYNILGCDCKEQCVKETCVCCRRSGTFYKHNGISDIKSYTVHQNDINGPTYECNGNCKCVGNFCGNRLVQFGPRMDLKVQRCQNTEKGMGLFTSSNIAKGNFVCEYAGEIINETEAIKRFKNNTDKNKMNYIFCIKEHFGETRVKTYIDPTYYGNIGRYINHSCEPNCKLFIVRVNDTMPILGIFADKDIEQNTEITYNYGEPDENFETSASNRKKCYCNSANCKKYLPFDVSLT